MRLLVVILIALVGLIQYPLWLGKGGWFRVWALQSQVAEQREINEGLRARNAALAAEVQDLQTGTGALEERARGDLGMIREGEVFVHILPHDAKPPAGAHGAAVPNVVPQAQAGSRPAAAVSGNRTGAGATSVSRTPANATSASRSGTGAAPAPATRSGTATAPASRSGATVAPASRSGATAAPANPTTATPAHRAGTVATPATRTGTTAAPARPSAPN